MPLTWTITSSPRTQAKWGFPGGLDEEAARRHGPHPLGIEAFAETHVQGPRESTTTMRSSGWTWGWTCELAGHADAYRIQAGLGHVSGQGGQAHAAGPAGIGGKLDFLGGEPYRGEALAPGRQVEGKSRDRRQEQGQAGNARGFHDLISRVIV
jgi:hypothetical protein